MKKMIRYVNERVEKENVPAARTFARLGIYQVQVGQCDVRLDLYNLSTLPAVSRSAISLNASRAPFQRTFHILIGKKFSSIVNALNRVRITDDHREKFHN